MPSKYELYYEQCEDEGETPLSQEDWHRMRMEEGKRKAALARQEAEPVTAEFSELPKDVKVEVVAKDATLAALEAQIAELKALVTPEAEVEVIEVPVEWGEDGVYRYYSEFKEHSLVMKSERAIGADGRLVTSAHKAIEFTDNHYTTTDKDVADWLENDAMDHSIGRKEFGWHIFRTTQMTKKKVTEVTDGPKTSIPQKTPKYADRPSPLHANA